MPETGLGVDPVVDREVARGLHGAGELDGLGRPHPRRADRDAEHVDGLAGIGQGVARVVDRGVAGRDDVAGVVEPRELGVDHRVQLADHAHREAEVEALAGRHDGDALGDVRGVLADPGRDAAMVQTGASVRRRWSGR